MEHWRRTIREKRWFLVTSLDVHLGKINRPSTGRDVTIKELASRLGYADYQYFIARFKEHWGESPGRYRKLVNGFANNLMPFPEKVPDAARICVTLNQ